MKQGFQVVDVDLHLIEPPDLWSSRLPEPYRSRIDISFGNLGNLDVTGYKFRVGDVSWDTAVGLVQEQSAERWQQDPHLALAHQNCVPEVVTEGMDTEGIDIAIFVPTLTFLVTTVDGADPEDIAAICRVYNDWAAEFCDANRDRFKFWAWVPRQSGELAAKEARRAVEELGASGVAITSGAVDGVLLCEDSFEPLWNELEHLDVPLGIHLYGNAPAMRDDPFQRYLRRGNPRCIFPSGPLNGVYQAMTSVTELVLGGVLEAHPRLRPVIMEASATWLLYLLHAMDDSWMGFGKYSDIELSLRPSDYVRRQLGITVESDEFGLDFLANACGLDNNLMFTTDYPHHDSPYPHGVDNMLGLGLDEELTRKILSGNAQGMFSTLGPLVPA